ncbi:MAG TPA: S8 family serine peptidase [Solirubrobacterales bacterium]|nr:S8 family serine peptidase [Solirubrobacterales bacterium]
MDPTLSRLVEAGDPDQELALLVRLDGSPAALPAGTRVVSRFGDVATVRVRRGAVEELWESPLARSVKAPRSYRPELVGVDSEAVDPVTVDRRRPEGLEPTGRGVVVGMLDWGLDFRHPAFRRDDGGTRLLALWDQAGEPDPARPNRFGYGRIHDRAAIDAALGREDPAAALGYDPAVWDAGEGTHGTATTSVAAGSAWPGGVSGVAPDAEIVFVGLGGAEALGDSVAVAEAIDFVRETAGDRPWVANLSLGRHGGPHDGCTLVEQLLDAVVREAPGRMIVSSAGNYFSSDVHTSARLDQGDVLRVPLRLDPDRPALHEIDLWYSGRDRFLVGLEAPDGRSRALARPGGDVTLTVGGRAVARIQHRRDDPNNGRNQAVLRIDPEAPHGDWRLVLVGVEVLDGRFHAWIEREASRAGTQARFEPDRAVATTTTGTICNGLRNLAVGACDHHDPDRPPTRFSSSGDTVDGRAKPVLLAPGERVLAARSRPRGASPEEAPLSVRMSGTSLAAPFVAGAVACLMEAAGRVPASRLRAALLESADAYEGDEAERAGNGYLNLRAAVEAVRGGARSAGRDAGLPAPSESIEPEEGEAMTSFEEPSTAATDGAGASREPDDVLRDLAISARGLFDVYVLGRREADRERLLGKVELVAGPGDRLEAARPGDLLVRGAMGEGLAFLSTLVTGELLDTATARSEGYEVEANLPGRCAWVVEGGSLPRPREDRFARRVADRQGFLPNDQALLRLVPAALPAAPEEFGEAVNRRSRDYIRWYQGALNQLESAQLAVDGIVGPRTQAAVRKYQARKGLALDGIVGPNTERALMADGAAPPPGYEGPLPAPPTPPLPVPPVPVPPPPFPPVPPPPGDDGVSRWRTLLGPECRDGNDVTDLIDGPETFRAFHAAIRTANARGHYIYLLGWWLDIDEPLDVPTSGPACPPAPRGGPSTVRNLFTAAAAAGVQIRMMLWDQSGKSKNTAEVAFVNGLPGGAAILDNHQSAPVFGSHHQKLLVVRGSEGLISFCGGIDVNCDRICPIGSCSGGGSGSGGGGAGTVDGAGSVAVAASGSAGNVGQPHHDVHCRVVGPAAHDLLGVFAKRWFCNAESATLDRAKGPLLGLAEPVPAPVGSMVVRVGETLNATATMPGGVVRTFRDRTVQEILLAVIGAARRYIYIEEQYLTSMCAAEAIRRALPNVDHVTILIGASEIADMPRRWELRKRFIDHIRASPHGAKLRVFKLCGPGGDSGSHPAHTYVHAKSLMADDEIAVIGSPNINRRGWEHDSEVLAAVMGPARPAPSLAQRLRTRLWSEHLGVPAAAVADPIASKGLWLTAPARRVCPYNPVADIDRPPLSWISEDIIDPPFPLATAPCCTIHGPSCPGGNTPAPMLAQQPAPAVVS